MKATYTEKVNTETKKTIAQSTVEYVEQVYKNIHGEEKLNKAIEQASIILNEKGIIVSETELKTLIESAVYGLSQGWFENETYTSAKADQDEIMIEQQSKEEA